MAQGLAAWARSSHLGRPRQRLASARRARTEGEPYYGGLAMTFEEILDQAMAILQCRGRLTYGTLTRQFQLADAALEDVKNKFICSLRATDAL